MSVSTFYRAFEDRYRGSRELIRGRLEAYHPFISPLLAHQFSASAADLGCGRGEWLELLRDAGFHAHGVDMDVGMLASCSERGLSVSLEDAIVYLRSLDSESQAIVSGFHIVEHISFEVLQILVAEALRVLQPGGLLILETPNPENLVVGTHSFYLDPTHHRPIPPLLLSFVVTHAGFDRVHTLRLQEKPDLHKNADPSLMNVLDGVSPDYAVVAQKAGPAACMSPLDAAFNSSYGITLQELADRYDQRINRRLQDVEHRLYTFESITKVTQERLLLATTVMKNMQAHLQAREAECTALRESWSWRITSPLRTMAFLLGHSSTLLRAVINTCIRNSIVVLQRPLARVMSLVLRDKERSTRLHHWLLSHFPALHGQLRSVACRADVMPNLAIGPVTVNAPDSVNSLSLRARDIHARLEVVLGESH